MLSSLQYILLTNFIKSVFTAFTDIPYLACFDVGAASNRLLTLHHYNLRYLQYHFFHELEEIPMTVTSSDWSTPDLTLNQIKFASYDAAMGRQIYDFINDSGRLLCFDCVIIFC